MEPNAHEIKNPLNFINNFSGVSVELIDNCVRPWTTYGSTIRRVLRLPNWRTPCDNLNKIVQHGNRADAIASSSPYRAKTSDRSRKSCNWRVGTS